MKHENLLALNEYVRFFAGYIEMGQRVYVKAVINKMELSIKRQYVVEPFPVYGGANEYVEYFNKNPKEDNFRLEGYGIDEVKELAKKYGIADINLIKPGIGEATRVLLRRVPWKILIDERYKDNPQLEHLIRLADEKNVSVEYCTLNHYKCCGIIKKLADA